MSTISYYIANYNHEIGLVALITGIVAIILISYEKREGLLLSAFSAVMILLINVYQGIYLQILLGIYYISMCITGYVTWHANAGKQKLKIREYKINIHLSILLFAGISIFIFKAILSHYLDSTYLILDASIFIFVVIATFLQIRKVIASWLYWIFIFTLLAILYSSLQEYYLVLLYLINIVVAFKGFLRYKQQFFIQEQENP